MTVDTPDETSTGRTRPKAPGSGSIWPGVVLHGVNNATALLAPLFFALAGARGDPLARARRRCSA
ncbi:hypothetical protein AB0M44_48255 [Streptosporangium subroseum]|uniref:hypothetical protein n=1 Tax=Streptosporangium subroseum TaxID=106412 RepID=UPI00341902B3